jgi:hypothetical protein
MGTRVVNDLHTPAKRRPMFSCIVCGKGTRHGWNAGLVSWKLVGICGCVGQGVGVHDLNTLTSGGPCSNAVIVATLEGALKHYYYY